MGEAKRRKVLDPKFGKVITKEKTLKDCLKNRYAISKDYYSWVSPVEKQGWEEIKQTFIKRYNRFSLNKIKDAFSVLRKKDLAMLPLAFRMNAIVNSYPFIQIDDSFIELALNSTGKEGISLSNYFVDNAIFLFPRQNKLGIEYVFVSTNGDYCSSDKIIILAKHLTSKNLSVQYVHKENLLTNMTLTTEETLEKQHKEEINTKYVYLIPQIFLYMATYQEKGMSIENVSNSNGQGFKKSSGKLLTPPTIGFNERHYVNEQKRLCGSNPDLQGIKKQTHWRRGHWRQYDNGKLSWIRPCLINPLDSGE